MIPKDEMVRPPNNQIETIKDDQPARRILNNSLRMIKMIAATPDIDEIIAPKQKIKIKGLLLNDVIELIAIDNLLKKLQVDLL